LGEKLLNLKISPYCRPHPRSIHIEAKAVGHYINSILATSEARKSGYDEALLLDCEGHLAEGPGANLFFEKDGALYTPALGHILPGITRNTVLELCAEMGIVVHQGVYTSDDLFQADSAFFCGTGAEIVGLQSVDGKSFKKNWSEAIGSALKKKYLDLVRTPLLHEA
jgi:branched-chain amino acid aminotransferase